MGLNFVIIIVLLGGTMWYMQRGQKKAAAQRQEQLDNMKIGSEIITIGGLHGILSSVDKEKGTIELDAEGVILTFDRAAIKTIKPVDHADGLDAVIAEAKTETVTSDETVAVTETHDSPFE
ncbi:preprotein translocase subunit YajC [Lactococcus hodotermopsidis]|uniref:Preprotein translocase subunit YajC n=1 Tax=Pseudolactococcus hodotermopsidis TaxID=2709157 RepID=A0A6A0B9W9_9LACT|nr:preprotein translocase subunit YajC [Lactococcus hodotermopsidis]GFH41586.1 preprotein translocase subunit YajC [Lactococcus hodotermopsidis]